MKVLVFVCSGNTCRSPMAAAILERILTEAGEEIRIETAGLSPFEGEPASENARAVMEEWGQDLGVHNSRAVTRSLLEEADLIVTMTRAHRCSLVEDYPEMDHKTITLGELAGEGEGDIPDPWGGGVESYRACRDELARLMEKSLPGLANRGIALKAEDK